MEEDLVEHGIPLQQIVSACRGGWHSYAPDLRGPGVCLHPETTGAARGGGETRDDSKPFHEVIQVRDLS